MTSRGITIAGFVVIIAFGLALALWARRRRSAVPSISGVLGHAMHTRSGRVLVLMVWFWFGWHFLAR
jgi:hypothetical protein